MPVRANKFREVEGEGTTWYASRTEAVGLGRVVPSSSTDSVPLIPSDYFLFSVHSREWSCLFRLTSPLTTTARS
jgi:hypothetical protein